MHPLLATDQIVQYLWADPEGWKAAAISALEEAEIGTLERLSTEYLNVVHKIVHVDETIARLANELVSLQPSLL